MTHQELLIGGHFFGGPCDQGVGKGVARSPYDGRVVGTFAEAGRPEMDAALDAAVRAQATWRRTPSTERAELLRRVSRLVRERAEELAGLAVAEIGKPVTAARAEVQRLALTFELAAESAPGFGEEAPDLAYDPRAQGATAIVTREPVGPVLAIVPYNWPYNLAAHKIAPALATGNAVVLKASGQAALCSLTLARIVHEAGCPDGVLNAVACDPVHAEWAARDPRTGMVSFTGSEPVGWRLKQILWEKRVTLELGGDAYAIVADDADLVEAVPRLIQGAFAYAGQICVSVQHILAQPRVYVDLRARLVAATEACRSGDPADPETVVGPLVSAEAADRVMAWIEEAKAAGARVLAGGHRVGNVVTPTLVEDVPATVRLGCEEVFGPVVTLAQTPDDAAAIDRVNAGRYGVQTGVFVRDAARAERFARGLEVGGVVIGDAPTLRFDALPYGGVRRSGFGREGVRYAMHEMTEPKAVVTRRA